MKFQSLAYIAVMLCISTFAFADDVRPNPAMLYDYFMGQMRDADTARTERYEALKSPDDIAAYVQRLRHEFVDAIGGLPERTPLNAKVIERLPRDGFVVEKVIFESMPGLHVSGLLFLPEGEGPFPGVLTPCGHSADGKAFESYQRASILLARNGMAAFCFDPISQGERHQILDENGRARSGGTQEHMYIGVGAMLLGRDTALYEIWDGIRALDYLESRPDIDAARIGCAGNSGGGTQTAYLMALDDRIVAAAPNCYITSFPRLLETIGPQDFEQNIFGQLAFGMDHADFLIMRAPQPTLIGAATQDFFDIDGTWDTYREAKRIYGRLGFPERVDLIETDAQHGWNEDLRVATARWMRRWLLEIDDAVVEEDVAILTDDEVLCTPRGEVLLLEGARSIFDYHADWADELKPVRESKWNDAPLEDRLEAVRALSGVRPPETMPEPRVELRGESAVDGGRAYEWWVRTEPGIVVPVTLLIPEGASGDVHLVLDGQSRKNAVASGRVRELYTQGHPVVTADLRGIGETESDRHGKGWSEAFGPDWQEISFAYLLGQSMVGLRADDITAMARVLDKQLITGVPEARRIHLVASGEAVPAALHAAALEARRFASLTLDTPIVPWDEVVRTPLAQNQFVNAVHGALREYDLPDLLRAYEHQKAN